MNGWKEEAIQQYKEECFKQTKSYQYELAYADDSDRLQDKSTELTYGTVIYFPDENSNILNFEGINSEYIVFVNRNGRLEENAIHKLLLYGSGADIIYCDEDYISDMDADLTDINSRIRALRTPWRKPDYSPDTLLAFPYIETCFAIKTVFARCVPALKMSPEITDNVRVWDFLLRATERTNRITHVPQILFHRDLKALLPETENINQVSDEEIYSALTKCYNRAGYRLCREAAEKRRAMQENYEQAIDTGDVDKPVVSIIIPSKDNAEMLADCIRNIRFHSGGISYEIIVVDNGSSAENKALIEKNLSNIPKGIARYIYEPLDFNFSRMCQIGAAEARADYLLFMNDDVEACDDRFIEKMLKYATLPYVGAVGVKLLYPQDNRIQHVGVVDINRGPTHKLITMRDDNVLYYGRNRYVWNVLAVTAACMMISKQKYYMAGGFCEDLKVAYNDVDLCVKLFEKGFFNVVNNECCLTHHESISRGRDSDSDEKNERLKQERALFYSMHKWLKDNYDPFYNIFLDRDTIEYKSYIVPDYQITDHRNRVRYLDRLPAKKSDHIKFSIDRCSVERAIGETAEDAYVFDGWALNDKCDNAFTDKYLVLVPLTEDGKDSRECIVSTVSPKYRADIKAVFTDVANVYLAGFECRIPFSKLEKGKRYRIGVCIRYKGRIKKQKLMLGDIYEPGRGIITDEQILSGTVREGEGEEPGTDAGIG